MNGTQASDAECLRSCLELFLERDSYENTRQNQFQPSEAQTYHISHVQDSDEFSTRQITCACSPMATHLPVLVVNFLSRAQDKRNYQH